MKHKTYVYNDYVYIIQKFRFNSVGLKFIMGPSINYVFNFTCYFGPHPPFLHAHSNV